MSAVDRILERLAKDDGEGKKRTVKVIPALGGLCTVVLEGERSYGAFERARALERARELVKEGAADNVEVMDDEDGEGKEREDDDAE